MRREEERNTLGKVNKDSRVEEKLREVQCEWKLKQRPRLQQRGLLSERETSQEIELENRLQ